MGSISDHVSVLIVGEQPCV